MFFEATYVPSPPLSVTSIEDEISEEPATDKNSIIQEVEPDSDRPVDHLIFVIHGIGQQTEQYGHFYEHIENLQETTRQVLQAKVPDHNVRIELIPIEWHRHIHEQVDPIINKITLKSIPTIRLVENDYLADVLYYFSKDRGQVIVDNVTRLFNTSYQNFMEKHPNFNGKIAIMGYSLGGIITWDILSHQREPTTPEETAMYNKLNVKFSKLDFKPNFFFGLGSPVGAVLTFRGQDPRYYHPDFDITFENIFHPFDPLGYRFEPLFSDYFIDKPAVLVERSVPIGPSFSFPSMPASVLSFFSWKQEDKVAKSLYNTTSNAVAVGSTTQENQKKDLTRQDDQSSGFLSSLYQYFSKGGGGSHVTDHEDQENDQPDGTYPSTNKTSINGIITWDPLREQTREQLLALRDDLDRTLNTPPHKSPVDKRPSIKTRSKTYASPVEDSGSLAASPTHSTSSSTVSSCSTSNTKPALRKSMTEQHTQRHHLVEVLGIDGAKMDTFDRPKDQQETPKHHEKHEINHGSHDLWSDLNKEIHKPGPAVTSPGETRAEIAQDATVPSEEETKEPEQDEQEKKEIEKLPGKQRTDYVLQPDSVMSMIANEYLIGLRAHFSYWTNKDFIWHMLRRIETLDTKKQDTTTKPSKPIVSVDIPK